MLKLFAVSYVAQKTTSGISGKVCSTAGAITRSNEDEARGAAIRICQTELFPQSEGWYAHGVALIEISGELMNDAGYFRREA